MPRNGSGTYSLPSGNPVSAGTLIDATWANNTLNDLANEMTDSLSRSGEGGMLAPFRLSDGVQATPGLAWSNEPSTGFYRAGTNEMWAVVGGTQIQQFTATGTMARFAAGAVGTPSVSAFGDTNTGIWFPAADTVAVSTAGAEALRVNSSGVLSLVNNPTLSAGTANGVLYLNGSKVATSGSVVTFDGTNMGLGAASRPSRLTIEGTNGNVASQIQLVGTGVLSGYIGPSADGLNFGTDSGGLIFRTGVTGNGSVTTGSEGMRLDSSGNLGLGVSPSAWSAFKAVQIGSGSLASTSTGHNVSVAANAYFDGSNWKYVDSAAATEYRQNGGAHFWALAASGTAGNNISWTQAMTLDASGNLGVGTTSLSGRLNVYNSDNAAAVVFYLENGGTSDVGIRVRRSAADVGFIGNGSYVITGGGSTDFGIQAVNSLLFATGGPTERARITSGGEFLVGATSAIASEKLYITGSVANYLTRNYNSNASPYGLLLSYTGAAPNGTGNEFLRCDDTGAIRATIRSNGGLANYQSNNVDLSDARTKKDIAPAASMWGKIGALEIVTYKYNDQTHDDLNVGVIAQQVEAVEPVWVDADGFGETPEGEEPLKTVYTKDITFAAIKALQEAMARIEKLEAEMATLKGG